MMVRKGGIPRDILTWINECLVVEVLPKAFIFKSPNFASLLHMGISCQQNSLRYHLWRVAAESGDRRKACSVCRNAIEMLEVQKRDAINNSTLPLSERNGDQQKPFACDTTANQENNIISVLDLYSENRSHCCCVIKNV